MLSQVHEAVTTFKQIARDLRPEVLAPSDAARLLGLVAEAKKVCASIETALASRTDTHTFARVTGVTESEARAVTEIATRLHDLPATTEAFRAGELSLAQVAAVATGASANPSAEGALLEAARTSSVRRLRDSARRVKAAAEVDQMRVYERQRRARSFRHGIDDEGMVWGHFRLPPNTGAAVVNTVERHADREFREAYREGRRESHAAYAADALVELVTGEARAGGQGAEVVVVVDHAALVRGRTEGTERCEVRGVGPVPVEVARSVMEDAFLKGVLVQGTEVTKVRHFGRHIPAEVRTALELRDGSCRAEGCDRTFGLEWDHVEPFAAGGPTALDNLQALCRAHHREKTAATAGTAAPGRDPP